MDKKLIILLGLDQLLLELDDDYEGVPQETIDLIYSRVLEGYGLTIKSSKEELAEMRQLMLRDVEVYRDELISGIE